jgi:hypothetical protein
MSAVEDGERKQRITDGADLGLVLGELDDETSAGIVEQLEAADARLAGLVDTLTERAGRTTWETTGVGVETYESGQAMLTGVVSDAEEGIVFSVELRPRNFFDDTRPWQPGQAPRVMSSDAWDVEGEVQVQTVTRIQGRKYTVQESAAELPEQRHETPEAAVAAFVAYVDELVELAESRDPVASAWQSADDADDAGGDDAGDEPDELPTST